MIAASVAFLVAVALIAVLYRRLIAAQFSVRAAAAMAALAAIQMATALTAQLLAALLFAAVLYLILTAALAFEAHRSVRNVILLGGSLALVQGSNPLGTVVAAALLPIIIATQPEPDSRGRNTALLVLLLFIPVSAAVLLTYVARTIHVHLPLMLAVGPDRIFSPASPSLLPEQASLIIHAAWMILLGLPAWLGAVAARKRRTMIAAAIPAAVVVAVFVAGMLGEERSIGLTAPAFAVMGVAVLSEWPDAAPRPRQAIGALAIAAVLAWIGAIFL